MYGFSVKFDMDIVIRQNRIVVQVTGWSAIGGFMGKTGIDKQAPGKHRWPRPGWSTSHWLHIGFAVAAIGWYILGGMAQSKVSGPPADFQLEQLTYPLSVGKYSVSSEPELLARIAGEPVGYPLLLRSEDGSINTLVTTQKLYSAFHGLITRINGLFFLAVSLIVFAPRIDKNPARDLFWACLFYGLPS